MTTTSKPAIHIYGPTKSNSASVRAACPVDGKLIYGRFTLYYDTWYLGLDCGAFVDGGDGSWWGHRGPLGGRGRRRNISRKAWSRWPIRQWIKRVASPA